jgi:hypothetical protein
MDARTLLLKFKGDLSALTENAKGVESTVKKLSNMLSSERSKSASEAKKQHDEAIRLTKEQAAVQINLIKAKQRAAEAETNYEKSLAASQIKRLTTKSNEIRLQQQLISLKEKQLSLDKADAGGGGGGISKLLASFSGAATGGGMLNTIIAGAAGGGAFLIFEKLASALGDIVKTFTEMPTKAGEMAEALEKSASRAGVTIQQFQQLKLAAAATGMNTQVMTRAVMMMNLQLTRGSQGLSKAELELQRFKVSIRDSITHEVVPATEIIKRLADKFHGDDLSVATKVKLASDVFSRRIGSQMIPLLNEGSKAVQELYDRADKYSILVDEDVIKAQHQWNVESAALKMQFDQLQFSLGQGILPLLVQVANWVNRIAEGWNQLAGVNAVKDFGNEVEAWARSKGMMAGKEQLKFNADSRSHLEEKVPEDIQRKLAEKQYGKAKADRMSFGKNNTWKDIYLDLQSEGKSTNDLIELFAQKFPDALKKAETATTGLDKRLQDNTKSIAKVTELTIKYNEVVAQLKEKQEEAAIATKKSALTLAYDQGLITQESFLNQSRELDKQDHETKLKYLTEYKKLEIQKVQEAARQQITQLGGEEPEEGGDKASFAAEQQDKIKLLNQQTAEKVKIINVQTKEKILAENEKFAKENQQLDLQGVTSEVKANQLRIAENLKMQQEILTNDKSLLDYQLKQRTVSVDEYMAIREAQIKHEVELSNIAAQEEYNNGKKTPEALVQLENKRIEARIKSERELTDLLRNETQTRLSFSESRYQGSMGLFQGQQAIAQMMPGGSGVALSNNAVQMQIEATKRYKEEQQALLHSTMPLSNLWFQILGNMTKATQELMKMNIELLKSKSVMVNVGSIFQQLSSLIGQFGVTRGGWASVGAAGGILEQLGSARAKRSAQDKDGGAFSDLADAFKGFDWHDMSDSMQKFNEGIKGAVGAVGSFIQMIGSSHGKAGDIAGGAIGGMGIGGDIGDMFSKFSKFAGPIGQVAGAAFGGILSGIIGHKNNQTAQFINSVNKQMADLQAAISNGTTGIQQGIQQLQSLRQSVISQEGHSKKKQKAQLEQEAQAINDQIIALQRQQEAMFIDLGLQLKVLNSPTQFQGLLGSLKDIMDQYKKFAGAARDAKDLAMANQFLADSLRNFADTQATALNEAEQGAIQDAIKLNDLLRDRKQLLTDEAQTEYDIMTQGVLVNQRTVAMTKMQQIQQARNQMNIQLQQMDQDIALTTYKVNSEKQIFDLATTRIDLEAQLLKLQEAQTDKEILRIEALVQIVKMLQSGTPLTNMDQILAALGLNSAMASPTPLGNGGMGGSIEDWLNNIRANRARGGFGGAAGYLYS